MHRKCTALFSLLCNMEICGTRATNTPPLRSHASAELSFGCDVQWQMNNVKWFIVLCIIINIVINFHDLHALQRASSFDIVCDARERSRLHTHIHTHLTPFASLITCLLHKLPCIRHSSDAMKLMESSKKSKHYDRRLIAGRWLEIFCHLWALAMTLCRVWLSALFLYWSTIRFGC